MRLENSRETVDTKLEKLHIRVWEASVSRHNGGSLKPLNTRVLWWFQKCQGVPQWDPHKTERRQPLGQLYVWSMFFLPAWTLGKADENVEQKVEQVEQFLFPVHNVQKFVYMRNVYVS